MGDRQEYIIVSSNGNYISLYEHWQTPRPMGRIASILEYIRDAGRQTDEPHATKILISQLIKNHESSTGYGITINSRQESEHTVPVICFLNNTVSLRDNLTDVEKVSFTFDEFIDNYLPKVVNA